MSDVELDAQLRGELRMLDGRIWGSLEVDTFMDCIRLIRSAKFEDGHRKAELMGQAWDLLTKRVPWWAVRSVLEARQVETLSAGLIADLLAQFYREGVPLLSMFQEVRAQYGGRFTRMGLLFLLVDQGGEQGRSAGDGGQLYREVSNLVQPYIDRLLEVTLRRLVPNVAAAIYDGAPEPPFSPRTLGPQPAPEEWGDADSAGEYDDEEV